jgi:hypothetical protein
MPPDALLRNGLMAEQPAVPDVAELTRGMFDAARRHDLDRLVGLYAPDAVGRPVSSDGHVEQLRGWVILGVGGKIEHVEPYFDATEALAAAECLAEKRIHG